MCVSTVIGFQKAALRLGLIHHGKKADADHVLIASKITISETEGIDRLAAHF
jgi:hypothetical protein